MAQVIKVARVVKVNVCDLGLGGSGGVKYLNGVVTGMVEGMDRKGQSFVKVYFDNGVITTITDPDEVIECNDETDYYSELDKCVDSYSTESEI